MKKIRIKKRDHCFLVKFYRRKNPLKKWKKEIIVSTNLSNVLTAVEDFLSDKDPQSVHNINDLEFVEP